MFPATKRSSNVFKSNQKSNQSSGSNRSIDPTEAIFSQQREKPRQELPKMKKPSLIEPSVGLKKDARTPLHKLLTFD